MSWKIDEKLAEELTGSFLNSLGDKASDEMRSKTPGRVAKAWGELLSGYGIDEDGLYKTFPAAGDDLVLVRNIEFVSVCKHHLLPFTGVAHIGYAPNGRILGLSKFVRIVNCFSRRLQTQEDMTREIGNSLVSHLNPEHLFVIAEAKHACIFCKGVKQMLPDAVTFFIHGKFKNYRENELLALTRATNFLKN
ncbi:MAG: GTP cyclohydrolase I [Rickettsiales bacterium]|jgi:GTP cyclohydrolase I|nr:GTP cyclohydrolase I [Rickettsiales bacterium]